jgi:hypothetical protein
LAAALGADGGAQEVALARRHVRTIRSVFVKIACRVEELKTRIKLSFPAHLPYADAVATVTARLCAQGPQGP